MGYCRKRGKVALILIMPLETSEKRCACFTDLLKTDQTENNTISSIPTCRLDSLFCAGWAEGCHLSHFMQVLYRINGYGLNGNGFGNEELIPDKEKRSWMKLAPINT